MKKVILFGAGGYSDNIRLVLKDNVEMEVVGYLDEGKTGEYHGLPIIGNSVDDVKNSTDYCYFVCIGDIENRKRVFDDIIKRNLEVINAISEHAYVSKDLKIGVGNYIAPWVKILADVEIKDNNYIGTSSIIEHGSRIGSHCRIGANATLNGETIMEDEVLFGSGAICNECISIGANAVVGSGSVVIKDVPKEVTEVGVPAKIIKKKTKKKLVIIGAGQQGRNCKRLAEELLIDVVAFVDEFEDEYVEGIKVYRRILDVEGYEDLNYIVAIGDIKTRSRFIEEIKHSNLEVINLIDPTAVIEKGAKIGKGNYIYKLVTIYKSAVIGDNNIINTAAVLATDCVIGDNCDIQFGSKICGDCHIGDNSKIGYNATISSGYNVGKNAVVEGSSVVYRHVNDNEKVEGVVK